MFKLCLKRDRAAARKPKNLNAEHAKRDNDKCGARYVRKLIVWVSATREISYIYSQTLRFAQVLILHTCSFCTRFSLFDDLPNHKITPKKPDPTPNSSLKTTSMVPTHFIFHVFSYFSLFFIFFEHVFSLFKKYVFTFFQKKKIFGVVVWSNFLCFFVVVVVFLIVFCSQIFIFFSYLFFQKKKYTL